MQYGGTRDHLLRGRAIRNEQNPGFTGLIKEADDKVRQKMFRFGHPKFSRLAA
jgi:hypothetical protein